MRALSAILKSAAINTASVTASLACPALAQPTETPFGTILSIDAGWGSPYMHFQMSFPVMNPETCPWAGLYTIPPDLPGYETFQSLAMSAFYAGKQVAFVLDGCTSNRPKIISVRVH